MQMATETLDYKLLNFLIFLHFYVAAQVPATVLVVLSPSGSSMLKKDKALEKGPSMELI